MIDHSYKIVVKALSKKVREGLGWLGVWIVVAILAFSCRRSGTTPAPKTQPLSVNLMYPNITSYIRFSTTLQDEFELILSESTGRILLDTMAQTDKNISTTVQTSDTLIDVTSVVFDSVKHQYYCRTFRAVDPTHWVTSINQDVQLYDQTQPGQQASLLYINTPSPPGNWYFNSGVGHVPLSYGGDLSTFSVDYTQCKNTYAYLYDPTDGLYKFYLPRTLSDVVDLSHMDTIVRSTFIVPPGDHLTFLEFYGVMDTTDLSTMLWLDYAFNPGLSFAYPPKYVQKYGMRMYGASADGKESFIYYTYGDTVPSTMQFQNSSSYTLNTTANNDFSVTFNGTRPSYFATSWSTGNISFDVWQDPSLPSLKALSLLISLHSRMLAGQDLSGLSLVNFNYEMAPGYGYADWLNYACNPSRIQTYRMGYESEYFKSF